VKCIIRLPANDNLERNIGVVDRLIGRGPADVPQYHSCGEPYTKFELKLQDITLGEVKGREACGITKYCRSACARSFEGLVWLKPLGEPEKPET
jgi:hypothetical protein